MGIERCRRSCLRRRLVLNADAWPGEAVSFTPSDTTDYATASTTVSVNVAQATTDTQVTSSANPAVYGQQVTFTATLTNTSGTAVIPTGTVQFTVDGANLGNPVNLDASGHATSPAVSLPAGTSHTVNAFYVDPASNFVATAPKQGQ